MAANAGQVRDTLIVVLAAAAAVLDAVAYLRMHVFVANMTGNTVLFGLALGGAHGGEALRAGIAIAAFFAGLLAGVWLGEPGSERDRWPAAVSRALMLEAGAILVFGVLWPAAPDALTALGALAMGMQSALTRDVEGQNVSSTFLSGTLMRLGFAIKERFRGKEHERVHVNLTVMAVYLGVAFGAGAAGLHAPQLLRPLALASAALVAAVALAARPAMRRARA